MTNTPNVLTADVADMAVGLLLAAAREIPQADRFVREGKSANGKMPLLTRVSGKTVGIVGMGRVGAASQGGWPPSIARSHILTSSGGRIFLMPSSLIWSNWLAAPNS